MGLIDTGAADRLAELMEGHGYTPESLALEIRLEVEIAAKAGESPRWGKLGTVDASTIRRILDEGHVPGPRVKTVLARFFDRSMGDIWRPTARQRKTPARFLPVPEAAAA